MGKCYRCLMMYYIIIFKIKINLIKLKQYSLIYNTLFVPISELRVFYLFYCQNFCKILVPIYEDRTICIT